MTSALFLTWDRHLLDGGTADKDTLVDLVQSEELYKLLGMTSEYMIRQAENIVDLYVPVKCHDRFNRTKEETIPESSMSKFEIPEEKGLEWLEQEESDAAVGRYHAKRKEQIRDRKKVAALRKRYSDMCQFCGTKLQIEENRFYSEAAHIRGLGKPHNGPDKVGNMLVLCPNHHIQFDRGVLRLLKVGSRYRIQSKIAGDQLHGKVIQLSHTLDETCVKYHYDWFASRSR